MITYTNCTPLSAITIINLISPELSGIESASGEDSSGTEPASGEDESGEDESGIGSGSGASMFCLFLTLI